MTAELETFAADGSRLISDDGSPTKAGYRELRTRAIEARGATRAHAEWLAALTITTSKRGSVAFVQGGTASNLSASDCRFLGREPGPGND